MLFRNTRPNFTKQILFQIFLCSIFGACLNQILYFVGLKKSTATIAAALTNMLPALTFVLALAFRLERVEIKRRGSQAKVVGTMICVGGAMLLKFFHGQKIHISQPNLHWTYLDHTMEHHFGPIKYPNFILGPLFLLLSSVAMATWYILQAKVNENFKAPYTSSALMCFMGCIQCVAVAACANHTISDWSLKSWIRLLSSIYAGLVSSALACYLMSWTIQRKGPLFVSVFSPLLLVAVAFLSWGFQIEKLYVGTVIGSVLIVAGLYTVLWGKSKEIIDVTREIASAEALDRVSETQDIGKQHQSAELKNISSDPSLSN
ncbi:hypothetical protein RND81_12G162600 [Saponaria officinalis]|uniref:WAT1-related protein n=1 Tax=Saponaria officinalis TaxID=3572 RepID=A0AAW1HBE3_SAPOF